MCLQVYQEFHRMPWCLSERSDKPSPEMKSPNERWLTTSSDVSTACQQMAGSCLHNLSQLYERAFRTLMERSLGNLYRTNCSLRWKKPPPTQINYNQLTPSVAAPLADKWKWIQAWVVFSSEFKCYSVYLILVRATALLSVFWNKARIRFLISELENSIASGPLPSAHLERGKKSDIELHGCNLFFQ